MYRESLLREVLFVLGLDVSLVIRRIVEVSGHHVGSFAEGGEFLQREVEQSDVIGLEREFPAGFEQREVGFKERAVGKPALRAEVSSRSTRTVTRRR